MIMSEKHLLVQGGTVYCSQSINSNTPSTAVPIIVTSQNIVDANGGKLVATEEDKTIKNMNFGLCNDPKATIPPPCKPQVKWNKVYKDATIGEQELYPLTEKSIGICSTCSKPGEIRIAHHGQQATVIAEELNEAELELMENLNPLVDPMSINKLSDEINIIEMY